MKYFYLLRNLAALALVIFVVAPANLDIIEDIKIKIDDIDGSYDGELNVRKTEPVNSDFKDIIERGSIRVITNYNLGSYFLKGGLDKGFEYEFITTFARQHDLTVEIILLQPDEDAIEVLNRGQGDIIASNFIRTPIRSERIYFSEPYNLINQHIILPNGRFDITSLEDLGNLTISVRKNSAQHEALLDLKEQGYSIKLDLLSDTIDKEAIIVGVAEGRYQATISNNQQFNTLKTYITGVHLGPEVSKNVPMSWGMRRNANQLHKEVDKYIYGNFKFDAEDNKIWKSKYLTMLHNRYFNNHKQIEQYRHDIHELMYYGVFSPYDQLLKPAAENAGIDWKLAVAVMAQESSFRPNVVSIAGAVGLMQIIPRFSQVTDKNRLKDPEVNISEGIRYLNKHLNHYSYLDAENQLALTLATYNAGMGHLADARRLVIDSNKNPNDWSDISDALLKLMEHRYYKDARHGYCRGTETVDYVERIMARYKTYQAVSKLANNVDRVNIEESILAMGKIGEEKEF